MASEQPNPSPPQTAAKTKKRPTSHETPTESTEKQRIKRPSKRKVIRPTEIVSPGEPPKRKQVKLQTIESSDEDDSGSLDSSDEEDVESIDLSDEEEDEYDDTDDDDEDDDDDDDDDDAESVYLSDSDEPEEANSKAVVKALTRTVRPASSRNSASATRRPNKNTPQPQSTFVETRTQSSRWIVAQQQASSRDATVTRGASSSRQQTVRQQFHTPNANTSRVRERRPQERGVTRGNSFRLNMSVDVNVSFSGLVTGRNLGFAGGQLSYAWDRNRQS